MKRTGLMVVAAFSLFVHLSNGHAEGLPRVVSTTGDTTDTVCLAKDETALWIGTAGAGMIRWTPDSTERLGPAAGLPGATVTDCAFARGSLWVATGTGLSRFNNHTSRFEPVARGRFLALAQAGDDLVAANDQGQITIYGQNGQRDAKVDFVPIALAGASNGDWAAGGVDGRMYYEGRYFGFKVPVVGLGFGVDGLRVLTADFSGFLFDGKGFVRDASLDNVKHLRSDGSSFETPRLAGMRINGRQEYRGATFVATDKGVYQERDGNWQRLKIDEMPCGDRLSALAEFEGQLWVGSFDRGLCRKNADGWTHFFGPRYLSSDMVTDIVSDGERLYVGTLKGLSVIDALGNFEIFTKEPCEKNRKESCPWHTNVTGVAHDSSRKTTWIADNGAVHKLGKDRWRHFYRGAGITSQRITRIATAGGRVAVGTIDAGIHLSDDGRRFNTINDQQGLSGNWVMDLAFDSAGRLWVATCTNGISVLSGNDWQTISQSDGIIDNYALAVKEIDGKIWVGTLSGLSIIGKDSITNFDTKDGLSGNEVHDILKIGTKIYLATDAGLTVLE
jgi:ligand-binding sensor domain-containing protein